MYLQKRIVVLLIFMTLLSCSDKDVIRHEHLMDKHQYPSDYMYLQRSFPHGKIDKQAFREGYVKAQKLKQQSSTRNGDWVNAGPINTGGRVVDIEGTNSALYVAAAAGGIFKTENMGSTWTQIFDNEATLSIGDMAISTQDNDIIYVGTGEANAGGGSLAYDGEGVFKSTDGGQSWQHLGLEDVGSIGRVAIDPSNDDIVFVAAMGTLFSENVERGIFRTKDGGSTWEKVLYSSPKTGGIDVVIDPNNPNIVYAALWERERLLYDRTYGGPTSGIFKSTDGGNTWYELTSGLPGTDMGRIGLALAPSNPEVIYATIVELGGNLLGFYRTSNGGNSWEERSIDDIPNVSFMWWFGRAKVDPTDENKVYHIGFRMNTTTDGGMTWEDTFVGVHVDQHEVWINPDNPQEVYLGNDGGVYYSPDGGTTIAKFENLPITQFYRCEVDVMQPEILYGGTQDNGTIRTFAGANNDWYRINGGDGFTVLVDPTDNNFVYATSQYGNLRRSENGGFNFMSATDGIEGSEPNNWNTPYTFDPNNPSIMYYGTSHLYRSTDRAITWNKISDNLTNGPYTGINPFGTLTSISVSPFNADQILVGSDDGNVWITNDLGSSWQNLSSDLPTRWVTSVNHHPTIENRLYVTFSGYRYGEEGAYVYTMDYPDEEWESISDGLPQVPVNDLLVIPETNEVVVASDLGVYISEDGDPWQLLSDELPNLIITDLDYLESQDKLIVATYGRSMYTYTFDRTVSTHEKNYEIEVSLSPNPASHILNVSLEEGIMVDRIHVFNIEGRRMNCTSRHAGDNAYQIDVSTCAKGNYTLSIETSKGMTSKPFVVVK